MKHRLDSTVGLSESKRPRPPIDARSASALRRSANTRSRLLDAAIRIYSGQATHQLSFVSLAREARVSNGTVYNYFINKDQLLEEACDVLMERFNAFSGSAYSDVTSGAARLAKMQRWFIDQAYRHHAWTRAVSVLLVDTPAIREPIAEQFRHHLRLGKRQGGLDYHSESMAVELCISSTCAGMRLMADRAFSAEVVDHYVEMTLRALGVDVRDITAPNR